VSATYIGPALSETMSHAAPTLCMNAPMSETTLARSRLRKIGVWNGRQRLGTSDDSGMFTTVWQTFDPVHVCCSPKSMEAAATAMQDAHVARC